MSLSKAQQILGLALSLAVLACSQKGSEAPFPSAKAASVPHQNNDWFVDVAAATGLHFDHRNGGNGAYYFPEIAGAGGALFDFDNDGDLDVYLVQSGRIGGDEISPEEMGGRLFRNDLAVGNPDSLQFTDVTIESGLLARGYGMGVAVADYDGDGWLDVYLSHFGTNQLFRNLGNGQFEDKTDVSGASDDRWSTSSAWLDFDLDGRPDLFVTNYVNFHLGIHKNCLAESGEPDYCGPASYSPVADSLFRNKGDGTFEDVSSSSRISHERGPGLGVITGDWNGDGLPDLYVANDGDSNFLWVNQGDGTFRDEARLAGCALNGNGQPEASMGLVSADFDGDLDEDLFMTHLFGETNTLYVNNGQGWFFDQTATAQLAHTSRSFTGFGTGVLDFDRDGWLDLMVANGAVSLKSSGTKRLAPFPYQQPNQLFRNLGQGRFEDQTEQAGKALSMSEVSRGLAVGDVDNDGDGDVLIINNNGPARLLLNRFPTKHFWLGVILTGEQPGQWVDGSTLEVSSPRGATIHRRLRLQDSYCSSGDSRILVGLGSFDNAVNVTVTWPDRVKETWLDIAVNQYIRLRKGTGTVVSGP